MRARGQEHSANALTAPGPTSRSATGSTSNELNTGSLFTDFGDAIATKLKRDVKDNLPVIKRPGNWDSEVTNGAQRQHKVVMANLTSIQQMI